MRYELLVMPEEKYLFVKEKDMLSEIIGKEITDIYTVGFVDVEKGQAEYYPDLRWVYFEFEDVYVEFESIKQYSRLKMQKVDEVRYLFETDEDMMRARSSIRDIVLVDSFLVGNEVKRVELKGGGEEECCAAKIILENEHFIFLDPSFLHGIGMGGREQEDMWEENPTDVYRQMLEDRIINKSEYNKLIHNNWYKD